MLKMPETIVCGDIGLVLLSGLGSRRTHPVGAEGATMARRAPFPLSSIPAYIDQSMKLIVCLYLTIQGYWTFWYCLVPACTDFTALYRLVPPCIQKRTRGYKAV